MLNFIRCTFYRSNYLLQPNHFMKYTTNTNNLCEKQEPVSEALIMKILKQKFPEAASISVEDTSGGCGAMFNISVETKEFFGLSIMKQHRLIYDTLKEQIDKIHGLHLETRVPKNNGET